jgi:hypothetical protein
MTETLTRTEPRQVAEHLEIQKALVPYVSLDFIARRAQAMGANMDVRWQAGALTLDLWWGSATSAESRP